MATRRRRCRCWWLPILFMVPLFFAVAGLSKGPIERGLAARARAALARDGVEGVRVRASNWGDLHLSGPAALRTQALAAVEGMGHRHDANRIVWADGAAPAPAATTTTAAPATTTTAAAPTTTTVARTTTTAAATTTTTAPATTTTLAPAPTTTVAPAAVDVTAAVAARGVTLTGFVASEGERTVLVNAAVAAFGPANVVDQLQVRASAQTGVVDGAVTRLAAVIGAFGPRVQTGQARLVNTALTVSGTAFTSQAAAEANEAVGLAEVAGGVTADGTIAAPAAPSQATLQARLTDLLGRSGINFAPDSSVITPESEAILETAAESILAVPGVPIEIGGHTDSQGSAAANRTLSESRANAVLQNLVAKGVPAAQLTAVGFGPDRPVADNGTPEGRAANRRIEFTVL